MLKWLSNLFKSIWMFIVENFWVVLVLVIVALAIFYPGVLLTIGTWVTETALPFLGQVAGSIGGFFAELGIGGAIAAGLGIAALLDPESVIDATSNGAKKLLEPFIPILKFGLGAWIAFAILSSDDEDDAATTTTVQKDTEGFYGQS